MVLNDEHATGRSFMPRVAINRDSYAGSPRRGTFTEKRATSVIWLHFRFKTWSDTEQKTAICKIRNKTIPAPDTNTINLFYHLKKVHEKEYIRIQTIWTQQSFWTVGASCEKKIYSQPKIKQSFTQGTPYEKTSQCHTQITCAISNSICKVMTPVYIVEKDNFETLSKSLIRGKLCPVVSTSVQFSCLAYMMHAGQSREVSSQGDAFAEIIVSSLRTLVKQW